MYSVSKPINLRSSLIAFKRILQVNAELKKVAHVPGNHCQPVNDGCSRNHGIFVYRVRPPVHEPRPLPEGGRVHRQYIVEDFVEGETAGGKINKSRSRSTPAFYTAWPVVSVTAILFRSCTGKSTRSRISPPLCPSMMPRAFNHRHSSRSIPLMESWLLMSGS